MSVPAHQTSPSLRNKVNFRKGWPNPSIVEEVLKPASGVVIEGGFIGCRNHAAQDQWILGVDSLTEEAFVFRQDSVDPDTGRSAHNTSYLQANLSGVQGISLQNPLEFETVQYVGTPAKGDLLHSPTAGDDAGKLVVAALADGTAVVDGAVAILYCVAPTFYINDTPYIVVAPVATRTLISL